MIATMRPRLRLNSDAAVNRPPSAFTPHSGVAYRPPSSFTPEDVSRAEYPHTSVFRSHIMDVSIQSAAVKMTASTSSASSTRPLPIYGDHDRITGSVKLASHIKPSSGRMSVSFEGMFEYRSPSAKLAQGSRTTPQTSPHKHIFFSESAILSPMIDSAGPLSAIVEAFSSRNNPVKSPSIKSSLRRKASFTSMSSSSTPETRMFAFSLPLPQKAVPGDQLPATMSTTVIDSARPKAAVEKVDVSYRLVAVWEPHEDGEERAVLEIPIRFQPEPEFQSADVSTVYNSWLEIPLRAERSVPFQCAVTIPTPSTFPRSATVPFFVVFSTTPRSRQLAREIASDATITVNLLRQVSVDSSQSRPSSLSSPATTPSSPPSSPSDEGSDPLPPTSFHRRSGSRLLLKRGARSARPLLLRAYRSVTDLGEASKIGKPLPPLPPAVLQDTKVLQTAVSIGFPKRPRQADGQSSTESSKSLPDGLYRGKIPLGSNMLPSFEWAGLSVKYYLEVSVLFGQDEQRVRVPVRVQ
ncbi:hypothetical protein PENSPDRAFT_14991 [Peniophora sp. CONT]|nr:hypothetical protein PENSPDRAFT_14991 [Peniophora sp. CONT]